MTRRNPWKVTGEWYSSIENKRKGLGLQLGQLDAAWMLYGLPIGQNADWLMWLEFMSERKGVMK